MFLSTCIVSSRMCISEGTPTTAAIAPRNRPSGLRRGAITVIAEVPPDSSLTGASRILTSVMVRASWNQRLWLRSREVLDVSVAATIFPCESVTPIH